MTVDLGRLAGWMDSQNLSNGPISGVETLGGGTQNILLRFRRGGQSFVLRQPPLHKRANSDETMRREARTLAALQSTDVPHPRLIAACDDLEVLGAAFYLMEPVAGANPTVTLPPPYLNSAEWRWQLGLAMADGAAAIGAVDFVALGLSDLGKPEGFIARYAERSTPTTRAIPTLAPVPVRRQWSLELDFMLERLNSSVGPVLRCESRSRNRGPLCLRVLLQGR